VSRYISAAGVTPAYSLGAADREYDTAPMSRPSPAYTGEPDIPAQIPRSTRSSSPVMTEPSSLTRIRSMPNLMPSGSTPTISPVNASGVVPLLTVRP
jgi:hypothetical protein